MMRDSADKDAMTERVDDFTEWASEPFQPNQERENSAAAAEVGERIADALEYIAAQLGEIARKLDHVGAGGATREDFERMNDLLGKL